MCGIAGIASFDEKPVLLEEIQQMCAALYHRGPDEDGFYISPDVGLGMRRLSIIDLKTGRLPVSNEDGSITTVFNGEIYNFQELRKDLQRRGHTFSTETDTEVIVHSYEEYGPRCVEKFRGMFVFAIWDERRRKLIIARDRLGIKPLYYTLVNGRLIFASELKSILQMPEVERSIDWNSLSHLFSFLTTPKDAAIIAGVKKLEAGHILTCSAGQLPVTERYWDVEFRPNRKLSEIEFIEELRFLLDESVRLHLMADVPLGAFLSGGLDSSSVVAAMARMCSKPVKTFSIGFSEDGISEDDGFNEMVHARVVAALFKTEHHELILKPNVLDCIEDIAWYLDEPFGDSSAIPTYMVSKLASEHVKVVISGDGGDELFAGYDKYLVEAKERRWGLPAPLRKLIGLAASYLPEDAHGANFFRHLALSGPARCVDSSTLFRTYQKKNLFTADAAQFMSTCDPVAARVQALAAGSRNWLDALQLQDLKNYLPLDILTKVDRMSMAHSIEARVPLLDHKLVEFAATVPPELRLKNGITKHILKEAMRGILPDPIIDRTKHGFAIPLGRWFRGKLGSFVSELLLSPASRQRGIFNSEYIEKLADMHQHGRDMDMQLWTLISFEMWCRNFLDKREWLPIPSSPVPEAVRVAT